MGSLGNPQTWVPYENRNDCSQGFCTLSCPQWCYIFPPPPPFGFPIDDSSQTFSPLVIIIIGILASAFLLLCYYTLISKYCGNSLRGGNHDPSENFTENRNQTQYEAWQVAASGLDEASIKSIGVCKYKKRDGLIEGTDCSVCLGEFQEDETLRLLPKCNHAFHLLCIDTWLRSHSNCPLCRANIVCTSPLSPLQTPLPVPEIPPVNRHSSESQESYVVIELENLERNSGAEASVADSVAPKTPSLGQNDLEERDIIIEIGEEGVQQVRRSVSIDSSCQGRVSIADVLNMNQDEDLCMDNQQFSEGVESSKQNRGEHSKSSSRSRVLHCVKSPTVMKRSFSGGRFLLSRHEKGGKIDY